MSEVWLTLLRSRWFRIIRLYLSLKTLLSATTRGPSTSFSKRVQQTVSIAEHCGDSTTVSSRWKSQILRFCLFAAPFKETFYSLKVTIQANKSGFYCSFSLYSWAKAIKVFCLFSTLVFHSRGDRKTLQSIESEIQNAWKIEHYNSINIQLQIYLNHLLPSSQSEFAFQRHVLVSNTIPMRKHSAFDVTVLFPAIGFVSRLSCRRIIFKKICQIKIHLCHFAI